MAQQQQQQASYQNWSISDFSAGMIDKVDNNLIPDNAASSCRNFISRTIGKLKRRPGQARLNAADLGGFIQGLHAYYYGSAPTRRLVAAYNGKAGYWNAPTSAFVEIKTGLNAAAMVQFENCVNFMVACNGVDAPWKWNGTTVSNLANAPADAQFPVLHKEQLFVVPKASPSTIKWSDFFLPETWPANNYQQVKDGDGDVITNLQKLLGQLVIFKERSIHVLRGTYVDDFQLQEAESAIGCVGPRAAVRHDMYIYFVSDQGICLFNGLKVINLTESAIPLTWAGVNKEHLHKAVAWVHDGLLHFAVPEGTSTTNDLVLVYVPPQGDSSGAWWPWRDIEASCAQVFNDGQNVYTYTGDATAGYVVQQDVGTEDFERQELRSLSLGGATGGTFTLGDGVTDTAALAFDATAATIQTALEGIYGAGNVTVVAGFTITFAASVGGSALEANFALLEEATNPVLTMTQSAFTPIEAYWVGKYFDVGSPEFEKKTKRAFVQVSPDTTNVPLLTISVDYGAFGNATLDRTDGLVQQYIVSLTSRWRYLAPKFTHSGAGECEVRGLLIPYKAKHKPKVRQTTT